MSVLPPCVVYTQDKNLARRVKAYLRSLSTVRHLEESHRLPINLEQTGPALVLVDVRAKQAGVLIRDIIGHHSDCAVVALGVSRSEPVLQAEAMGVYAVLDPDADRLDIQNTVRRVQEYIALRKENRLLRNDRAPAGYPHEAARESRKPGAIPLEHFSRAFRNIRDLDTLLENIVDGLSSSLKVSRVGIFSTLHGSDEYRFCAGLKCIPETQEMVYTPEAPLVNWLEMNAHVISPMTLANVEDIREQMLLEQALKSLGAEVVAPLHARDRLLGWLFLGHRVTGQPFDYLDLEDLMVVTDHISTTIENALLYQEVAVQKSLADTLFHAIPIGIVAVDDQDTIRWFNDPAGHILDRRHAEVINQPSRILGSHLSDILRRTVQEGASETPVNWTEGPTKRYLSAETHRLVDQDVCVGAVALVQDMTRERRLREKQEQLERTAFWTELAASMSHEIRNPLVAIKTFAQLLPERYSDPEFRSEFSILVSDEIDRLNSIIEQINGFAHPPELEFKPLDMNLTIEKGLDLAAKRVEKNGIKVQTDIDSQLPAILGDERALAECIAQILENSMEACLRKKNPKITLTAKPLIREGRPAGPAEKKPAGHSRKEKAPESEGIVLTVQDNAGGIPSEIVEKVFSPFCTTKARGMGLGLPIVKRTVVDHSGEINIETTKRGTCVSITLPKKPNEDEL